MRGQACKCNTCARVFHDPEIYFSFLWKRDQNPFQLQWRALFSHELYLIIPSSSDGGGVDPIGCAQQRNPAVLFSQNRLSCSTAEVDHRTHPPGARVTTTLCLGFFRDVSAFPFLQSITSPWEMPIPRFSSHREGH